MSYDLQNGIEKIRWGQSPQEVLALYPHAIMTTALSGRDHDSHEDFQIAPGLMISDFFQLPSFAVWAHINFDQNHVVGVDLYPHVTYPHRHLPPYVRRALTRFNDLLNIQIDLDGPAFQSWMVLDTRVDLHFARTDFMFSIYAPSTEDLHQSTYAHRSYRRSQAQRCLIKHALVPGAWIDSLDEKPSKDEK